MSTAAAAAVSSSHGHDNPSAAGHDSHHESEEHFTDDDGWLWGDEPGLPVNDPTDVLFAVTYLTVLSLFLVTVIAGHTYRPNMSIRQWAREEAIARGVFIPPLRPDITDEDEL